MSGGPRDGTGGLLQLLEGVGVSACAVRSLPRRNGFTTSTKEHKVKPTEHIAKSACPSKTGLFATLRGPLRAHGSGAPARSSIAASLVFSPIALCALLCALVGAFACASVARAEPPKLIPYGNFSAEGAFGIAVDQANGDVYTSGLISPPGFGEAKVNKFDATGQRLVPSPFGEAHYGGAAVNPTNGDVYVLGAPGLFAPTVLYTYNSDTGALVSSFEVPASRNIAGIFTGIQIAADAAGDVYVPVTPENEVLEYDPATCPAAPDPCVPLKTFTGGSGSGALKEPTGVTVDSSGDLWIADTGNDRIEELDSAGTPVGEIGGSEGVQSVALDGHGHVFALVDNSADSCGTLRPPCEHLMEYTAAGAELADVGAGTFGGVNVQPSSLSMLAVDEASGRVYVSDMYNERVWVYGPPAAPIVGNELTAEVGTSEAKLGALVNPGGIQTAYRFEYGTTTAYGQSTPFPAGSVGENVSARTVWAAASGLQPGTTYHYRVVATNELAPEGVAGPDRTFTTLTAEQAACPNEQLRGGFSARLPDCRAYELVTPPVDNSSQVRNGGVAAANGEAVSFTTKEPRPGAPSSGYYYVATRGAGGWGSEDVIPLTSYGEIGCELLNAVTAYSGELSKALILGGFDARASGNNEGGNEGCNPEGAQVVAGEPVGYHNLLLRDNAIGGYQLINAPPAGVTPADATYRGASADLSHVIFSERAPLTPGAPGGGAEDLYEWDEGAMRLLTVLPGEIPAQGSLAERSDGSPGISADGSHILFISGGSLYVRVDGSSTVQVDASQTGGPGGGGSFQAMSADGSTVLFTDESRLTPGSTAAAGEPDLYECVLPVGASRCELSDLTAARAGEPADVLKVSPLGSQDSSHVYFLAKGALAAGATSGQENLYLWDGGTTTFIATLNSEGTESGVGAVSPDGAWFAFVSAKSLTGYDNIRPGGGPQPEVFLYSAASGQLACASCNPSGEAPAGGGTSLPPFAQRPLSDGGRLFFETQEALVPSDTNGQRDVYEYENGQQHLISSGTSSLGSTFIGAGESGDDVFFLSSQRLVPQDVVEETPVIYDARVDGGFPEAAAPPPCATADACRAPVSPQPSIYGAPSSQTFSGAGNLAPVSEVKPKKAKPESKPVRCRRGFVKRKGECVRRPTKKARKTAHANRTGK
jgi:hypothetical protein